MIKKIGINAVCVDTQIFLNKFLKLLSKFHQFIVKILYLNAVMYKLLCV